MECENDKICRDAENVDVYTGALSEPPLQGSIVGPLLSCLITDQFLRLKKGDSHWYERRVGPQKFTEGSFDDLKLITIAISLTRFVFHLICRAIETNLRNHIGIDHLPQLRFSDTELAVRYAKNGYGKSNAKMFRN